MPKVISSVLNIGPRITRFRMPRWMQIADREQHDRRDRQCGERVDVRAGEQEIRHVGAQHDERAMRQVDDIEHAPDQGEPQRHQRVEPAQENAADQDLRQSSGAIG